MSTNTHATIRFWWDKGLRIGSLGRITIQRREDENLQSNKQKQCCKVPLCLSQFLQTSVSQQTQQEPTLKRELCQLPWPLTLSSTMPHRQERCQIQGFGRDLLQRSWVDAHKWLGLRRAHVYGLPESGSQCDAAHLWPCPLRSWQEDHS